MVQYTPSSKGYIKDAQNIFSSPYFDKDKRFSYGYRPLVRLSFLLEHVFWGKNVSYSHGVNVFIYVAICFTLFLLICSLLKTESAARIAFASVLLFALHPLHVEVVASLKNRDELLALFFVLLGYASLMRYGKKKHGIFLFTCLCCFFLALLSKKTAWGLVVFSPVFFFLRYDVLWKKIWPLGLIIALMAWAFLPLKGEKSYAVMISLLFSWSAIYLWKKDLSSLPLLICFFIYALLWAFPYINGAFLVWGMLVFIFSQMAKRKKTRFYLLAISLWSILSYAHLFWIKELVWLTASLFLLYLHAYRRYMYKKGAKYVLWLSFLPWILAIVNAQGTFSAWIYALFGLGAGAMLWLRHTPKRRTLVYYIAGIILLPSLLISQGYSTMLVLILPPMLYAHINVATARIIRPKKTFFSYAKIGALLAGILAILYTQTSSPYRQISPPEVALSAQAAGRTLHYIENPLVQHDNLYHRSATATHTLGYYLYLHLYPFYLSSYYGFDVFKARSWKMPMVWVFAGIFAALLGGLYVFRREKSPLLWSFIGFLVCLLPVSNLGVLVAGGMAERLSFQASLFFCFALGYILFSLLKSQYLFFILLFLLSGVYFIKSNERVGQWRSPVALFSHDTQHHARSAKLQHLAGNAYLAQAYRRPAQAAYFLKKAEKHLHIALALYEDMPPGYRYDLALVLQLQKKYQKAMKQYLQVLKKDPSFPDAQFNLATCLEALNQPAKAIQAYEKHLALSPTSLEGYANLTALYFHTKQLRKAKYIAEKGTKYLAHKGETWLNLAQVYIEQGYFVEAKKALEKAKKKLPCRKNPEKHPCQVAKKMELFMDIAIK